MCTPDINLSLSPGIERQSSANIDGKFEEHTRPWVAARRTVQRRFRAQLRQETEKETVLKGSGYSQSYATIVDQIVGEVPAEGRLFLQLFLYVADRKRSVTLVFRQLSFIEFDRRRSIAIYFLRLSLIGSDRKRSEISSEIRQESVGKEPIGPRRKTFLSVMDPTDSF